MRVVTFGEAMLRLTTPPGERLRTAGRLLPWLAGAEANVAVALAHLGVPTEWVSVLPDNPLGLRVADGMRATGVRVDRVDFVPDARLGLFFLEAGAGARPSTVWYDRADSAFARHARWPAGALDGARFAVVSGVTPAVSGAARAAAAALADEAGRLGVGLCVDVNYRGLLWPPAAAREALVPLLAAAEVVVCSERDARTVFDAPADPVAFGARFAPSASTVVITRGAAGAVGSRGGEVASAPAVPTELVDRLGMGDAFVAGLLSALLDGLDLAPALARATALAAVKATVLGDQAAVTRPELDRWVVPEPSGVVR